MGYEFLDATIREVYEVCKSTGRCEDCKFLSKVGFCCIFSESPECWKEEIENNVKICSCPVCGEKLMVTLVNRRGRALCKCGVEISHTCEDYEDFMKVLLKMKGI